jgi:hypothetical protein
MTGRRRLSASVPAFERQDFGQQVFSFLHIICAFLASKPVTTPPLLVLSTAKPAGVSAHMLATETKNCG